MKSFLLIISLLISNIFAINNYSLDFDYMSGYAESELSSQEIFGNNKSFTVEVWYKNNGMDQGSNSSNDDQAYAFAVYR